MYMLKEISRVSPWILAPNAKAESLLYGPYRILGAFNFNLALCKMNDPYTECDRNLHHLSELIDKDIDEMMARRTKYECWNSKIKMVIQFLIEISTNY